MHVNSHFVERILKYPRREKMRGEEANWRAVMLRLLGKSLFPFSHKISPPQEIFFYKNL